MTDIHEKEERQWEYMANRVGSERDIGVDTKESRRGGGRRTSVEKQGVLAQKGEEEMRDFSANGEQVYPWSSKGWWQARGKRVRRSARMRRWVGRKRKRGDIREGVCYYVECMNGRSEEDHAVDPCNTSITRHAKPCISSSTCLFDPFQPSKTKPSIHPKTPPKPPKSGLAYGWLS